MNLYCIKFLMFTKNNIKNNIKAQNRWKFNLYYRCDDCIFKNLELLMKKKAIY